MCRLSAEEYYPGKYCEPGIILKGILYVVSSMRWSLAPVLDCLFIPRQPPASASAAGRLQPDTELWINPCSFEVGLSIKHELLMLWFDVMNWYVAVQTDLHTFSTSGHKIRQLTIANVFSRRPTLLLIIMAIFLTIPTGVKFECCKVGRIQHLGPVSPSPLLSTKRVLSDQRDVNQLSFISCFI